MAAGPKSDAISYFCFGYRIGNKLAEYQVDQRLAGTWEKAEVRFRAYEPNAEIEYREVRHD